MGEYGLELLSKEGGAVASELGDTCQRKSARSSDMKKAYRKFRN